ncbi:MAG: sodium:proton antiporter, partial [Solirubrobacterales bacterium]|nr:sodium:proton antiporter [Solirubrobacterales bacterium]
MEIGFAETLLVAGLLIAIAAALSGLMRGTVLSISVLAVGAGILLATTDVITVDPGDPGLVELIELALILTLFADGLLVERELLRVHWSPTARAIAIAMPLTLLLLALAAKALFPELTWAEAFLLGAVLSPTDPVVTSAVVTARRVPAEVRHTLNLESGLNDGLALPFVLFFLVLASPGGDANSEAVSLLGEAAAGVVIGAALGYLGGRLVPALPGGGLTARYEGLYALGLGAVAYGISDLTIANGLIAVFVCGISMAAVEHELPEAFSGFSENVSAIFQVLTFFAFGALIVSTGFTGSVLALLALIVFALLVARPVAILIALVRTRLPTPQRLFIAWFGPRGVASMLFALFVLNSQAPDRSLVFDVAAFVILASIIAHGLTDTVG